MKTTTPKTPNQTGEAPPRPAGSPANGGARPALRPLEHEPNPLDRWIPGEADSLSHEAAKDAAGAFTSAKPSSPARKPADLTALMSDTATQAADAAKTAAKETKDNLVLAVQETATATAGAVKAQAAGLAQNVGDELTKTADAQKEKGADQIKTLSRAIHSAAGELEGQSPKIAGYVHDAAMRIDDLSEALRGKTLGELMTTVSSAARDQPLAFLAGAVAAGFAASRFFKSSAMHRPATPAPALAERRDIAGDGYDV